MCKIGSFGGHVLYRSAVRATHLKLISVCLENNLGGFVLAFRHFNGVWVTVLSTEV